jgi:DNA processing protein
MTAPDDLQAHAATLAGLAGMTPVRLAKVLDGFDPVVAFHAVRAGTHPGDPGRRFRAPARDADPRKVARDYQHAGVEVLLPGRVGYPSRLLGDPGAPAVLFSRGHPGVAEGRPAVAVVGTRSATAYGRQVAAELAAELADHDVTIVSGLAEGIDAAAHAGVVVGAGEGAAPPVAVVGTGLDVVYPTANRELWDQVARRGAVLAESPLGTPARPGVFPARNRIIAALSDIVVVVESHLKGGSLYTAEAAARRSIPVCAVPGSVRSASSAGTNSLLVDGCTPVRDATDVLVALALACPGDDEPHGSPTAARASRRHPGRSHHTRTPAQCAVLAAVESHPTALETILLRTDLSIAEVAATCDELVEGGALVSGPGWWSQP